MRIQSQTADRGGTEKSERDRRNGINLNKTIEISFIIREITKVLTIAHVTLDIFFVMFDCLVETFIRITSFAHGSILCEQKDSGNKQGEHCD